MRYNNHDHPRDHHYTHHIPLWEILNELHKWSDKEEELEAKFRHKLN